MATSDSEEKVIEREVDDENLTDLTKSTETNTESTATEETTEKTESNNEDNKEGNDDGVDASKDLVEEEEEYVELADQEDQEATTEIHVIVNDNTEEQKEKGEKEDEAEEEDKNKSEGPKKPEVEKTKRDEKKYKRPRRTVTIARTGSLEIQGFKRPLRLEDVKKTLRSFGKVKLFWMNHIKSKCLVTFEEEGDAINCKKSLDKTYFPPSQKPPIAGKLRISKTDEKHVAFAKKNIRKDSSSVSRLLQKALNESTSGEQFPRRGRKRGREPDAPLPRSKRAKKKKSAKAEMAEKLVCEYFKTTTAKPKIYWKFKSDEDIAKEKKEVEEKRQRELERRPQRMRGIPGRRGRSPPPRRRRFSRERDRRRDRDRDRDRERGRRRGRSPPRRYRR